MATFVFQAKTGEGKFVKGELDAGSEAEARVKIRAQKLVPLKIVPKSGGAAAKQKKAPAAPSGFFAPTVKPKELQVFTRQFAVLIGAGVPIVQSLEAMLEGVRNPYFAMVLKQVLEDVGTGKQLGDALVKHPRVFDRLYVNLVKAGEEGGVLDSVLNRLAEYIEKSVKLRGKVVGALWYPAAIVVVAILVIAGIMGFVIPNFVQMFANVGKDLPTITQLVVDMSNEFREHWYIYMGIAVGIPMGIKMYYDTDDGRKVLDVYFIELPIFGPLIQKGAVARVGRTLATLLGAGVRIMDSLEIAAVTAGNYVIERAIQQSKESVSKGRSLAEPMRGQKHLPDMMIQMVSVGEQTGNLDAMLEKLADFYEDEVETAAEAMTSMIEPVLMVVLGGIIAVLVIAMYLPIFNFASVVGG